MRADRMAILESQQTAIARKVLEAVPISEAWSVGMIARELHRTNATFADMHRVGGCLRSLVESGLIREPRPGVFQRLAPRVRSANEPADVYEIAEETAPMPEASTTSPATSLSALDRFAAVAKKLRDLATLANLAATEIEEAALAAETELTSAKSDGEKLRALQSLLRSIESR